MVFKNVYDFIIGTTFEKNNVPYIGMIAYENIIGASFSSDIVEAYDLTLKTVEEFE